MNKRIQELVERAPYTTISTEGRLFTQQDLAKFTELLVREMLQTCEDHPAWTGRMIGEKIKQHFGVE